MGSGWGFTIKTDRVPDRTEKTQMAAIVEYLNDRPIRELIERELIVPVNQLIEVSFLLESRTVWVRGSKFVRQWEIDSMLQTLHGRPKGAPLQ